MNFSCLDIQTCWKSSNVFMCWSTEHLPLTATVTMSADILIAHLAMHKHCFHLRIENKETQSNANMSWVDLFHCTLYNIDTERHPTNGWIWTQLHLAVVAVLQHTVSLCCCDYSLVSAGVISAPLQCVTGTLSVTKKASPQYSGNIKYAYIMRTFNTLITHF